MTGQNMLLSAAIMPMVFAFIAFIIGKKSEKFRNGFVIISVFAEAVLVIILCIEALMSSSVYAASFDLCGLGLSFKLDGFRVVYSLTAVFMWLVCTIFSNEYMKNEENKNRYYFFWLFTLGAVMGVFMSNDLFTAFMFFEIMSFTSYVWVAQEEKQEALRAASTYLAIAVIGGMVTLIGMFMLYNLIGTLSFDSILESCSVYEGEGRLYLIGALIFTGFAAKAGVFPLHIWLPKAHPVAPAPASALLSGMLTKVGIFGILIVSCNIFLYDAKWGSAMLFLGIITMFLGALLALFSVDLKRTLACSSVSQIGFIMVGVGMQGILGENNILAISGTILHMVNHSMFKLVLFLVAGVVVMNIHKLNLNEIKGFGRKKPFLNLLFLSGALGISGIPFFSGYISKTLLHESITEAIEISAAVPGNVILKICEIIFLITGGLTIAYMTKLYIAIFIDKNEEQIKMEACNKKYISLPGAIAISIPALFIVLGGLLPNFIMNRIAGIGQSFMHCSEILQVKYFAWNNLKGSLISIIIGIAVYIIVVRGFMMKKQPDGSRVYVDRWPKWLDLENLIYRPLILTVFPYVFGAVCRLLDELLDGILLLLRKTLLTELKEGNVVVGSKSTYNFGRMLNALQKIGNKTIYKKKPRRRDYVVLLAEIKELNNKRNRMVASSLSYGLIMFCAGLCITCLYLIFGW